MADNIDDLPNDDQYTSRTDSGDAEQFDPDLISDELPKKPRITIGPPVFGAWRLWIVVIPFIVYLFGMMVGEYTEKLRVMKIEGTINKHHEGEHRKEIDRSEAYENISEDDKFLWVFKLKDKVYPYTYTAVIGLTTFLMLLFGRGYFKAPFSISFWSILAGIVGIVVWIGLVKLDQATFDLGKMTERAGFNPFEELKDSSWMWTFIAIRFFGLVMVVPIVEEFFIRGFLMRYVDDPDWDLVPLGIANIGGWVAPTIYGVVAHLTEPISALVWFSMVTLLYKKTGSIWDCVVAHAITNLLLGIYVVTYGEWYLW